MSTLSDGVDAPFPRRKGAGFAPSHGGEEIVRFGCRRDEGTAVADARETVPAPAFRAPRRPGTP